MGLFSSKKKTEVFTSVVRVIEDTQIPNSAKAGVLKAIVRDENISEHLVDALNESIVFRAERMFDYAERKYFYGLPSSTLITDIQGEDIVRQVIEDQIGKSIMVDYCKFAPINSLHVGWQTLVNQYGYDEASNEIKALSIQQGVPVYLKDMVVIYPQSTVDQAEPGTLDKWGKSPASGYTPERQFSFDFPMFGTEYSKDIISPSATHDSVQVSYVFELERIEQQNGIEIKHRELREGAFLIPVEGYDEEEDFYHVKYYYETVITPGDPRKDIPAVTSKHVGYWLYQEGSGEIPEIDNIYRTRLDEVGSYFPIIYFRHDKKKRTRKELRETEAFKTSERMLKYLNMDFIEVSDAIHENPDIKDIEQAFMMWGVPAKAESEIELRYLFDYFNLLYYESAGEYVLPGKLKVGLDSPWDRKVGRAIKIQDKEFKMTLSFLSIGKRRVAGKIGEVGTHKGGFENEKIIEEYDYGEGTQYIEKVVPYRYYQRQINETFYEEVAVFRPRLSYAIWRGNNYVAGAKNDALMIPLDHAMVKVYSPIDREELYSRSLHFVFNTRITTKEKWYQSGWFKVVMIIVAIVLTIIYPPGGAAMWAAIAAMGTAVYIAAILLVVVIQNFVVGALVKFVAKALGPEVALLLAVVAIVYAGGKGLQQGLSAMQKLAADALVKFGTNLAQAAFNQHTSNRMAEYRADQQDFDLMSDKLMKELEEIKKTLDVSVDLNPFEFIGEVPMLIAGEAPDTFYQRTVHSGNIGLVGLDAVHRYVDLSLKLPDFADSAGEFSYT